MSTDKNTDTVAVCLGLIGRALESIDPGFFDTFTGKTLIAGIDRAAGQGDVEKVTEGLAALRRIYSAYKADKGPKDHPGGKSEAGAGDSPETEWDEAWRALGKEKPKPKEAGRTETRQLKDVVDGVVKSYRTPPKGLFTGIKAIDDKFGRTLRPGDLTTIAARPSVGKTVLGLQLAEYHAADKLNALVWSLEMTTEKLIDRLISKHAGVTLKDLSNRTIPVAVWPAITTAAQYVHQLALWCNDMSSVPVATIVMETHRKHKELLEETGQGLGLIVIDYIQLATAAEAEKREREVSIVSGALRCLAKDLNLPVVALAQLNREVEKRSDKRPSLADLRESGAMEMDSATVIFLYREMLYCEDCRSPKNVCMKNHEHDAEIIFAKNREGELGSVEVFFDGARQLFRDQDDEAAKEAAEAEKRRDLAEREAAIRKQQQEQERAAAEAVREAEAAVQAQQAVQMEMPDAFKNVPLSSKFDNLGRGVFV